MLPALEIPPGREIKETVMICSTTYRSALSVVGAMVMTLGTFSMLQASAPWDSPASPRSEAVGYQDTDLTRASNTARLYKRIHSAAVRVCAPLAGSGLGTKQRAHKCVDDAVAAAVAEINHPQLSALHSATIGRWQVSNARAAKSGV
jgi:UrcA family protein